MNRHERDSSALAEYLRYMVAATDAVVAAWASGDLAGAVNELEAEAERSRAALAEYDAKRAEHRERMERMAGR